LKIYGEGILNYPGTHRVAWDFIDGPFDTVNPVLLQEAKRLGFSFNPPKVKEAAPAVAITKLPIDTPKRRGRPRSQNVNP